jgi:hypothetical protein
MADAQLNAALGINIPPLPITERMTRDIPNEKLAPISTGNMAASMQERRTAETGLRGQALQAESEILQAEQAQKVAGLESKQASLQKEATELSAMPERQTLKQAQEGLKNSAFVPTKDNAEDIATFFSLMGIVGMAIGGGGKDNAYAAMAGMNGMLEGYKKGRADIYKRERDMFEKNFKAMQTKVQIARDELADAVMLKTKNFEAGRVAEEVAIAKTGSSVLEAKLKKQGSLEALKTLDQLNSDVTTLDKRKNDFYKQEEERQFKERQLKEQMRDRAESRALRLQMAEMKTGGGAGKPLPAKEVSAVEGLSSLSDSLKKLEQDFKPEFASMGLLGFGAEAQLEATRRLGGKKAQEAISWWSRYNRLQAPNRHALFGATLTGNELKNFQSFTAKPSDSAETVKTMLRDQADYSDATARQKTMQYESAGYRVPQLRQVNFEQTYGGNNQAPTTQGQPSGGTYQIDQIITKGNKKYRITGLSNPNDPDVEEVK